MRIRSWGSIVATAALATVLASVSASGQSIPRLADGKPDFNGIWDRPRILDITRDSNACGSGAPTKGCVQKGSGELAYTAWGREQWTGPRFDYAARCLPWGYTRAMQRADPKTYTKAIQNTRVWVRMKAGEELMEWWCMEHNKDLLEGHLADTHKTGTNQ